MQSNSEETSLDSFVESLTGKNHLRVQDDLGDGFVRLRAAEAQRRQAKQDIRSFEDVVIEMLRNSRDANAQTIYVATWKEKNIRHLTLLDDGDGIPPSLHETVFEPFVTSKLDSFHSDRWGVHGRGMALYSIRENADEAYVVTSEKDLGSDFHVSSSLENLPEKKDQSTIPYIVVNETNKPLLRGPHNIMRTVMEFAIDERDSITVYLGSPVEIAATLYHSYLQDARSLLSFSSKDESVPVVERLSYTYDPDSFEEEAINLALPLSNRTARRILNEEIGSLNPFIMNLSSISEAFLQKEEVPTSKLSSFNPKKNQRGLKITDEDIQTFKDEIKKSFSNLADAYYLSPDIEPVVRITKDMISIKIDIEKL